jgi:hypothetical protein
MYDIGTNVPEACPIHIISVASNVVSLPQIVNYFIISDPLKLLMFEVFFKKFDVDKMWIQIKKTNRNNSKCNNKLR